MLPGQEAGPLLAAMTGNPVAIAHVVAHWDELLRFATSIRTVTASAMLRRLCNRPASPACRGGVVCQDVL